MIKAVIFPIVGGLALFLFGMNLMSEGLKKVAGPKLKNILKSMTKKRLVGCLVGAGVTALIQSSSATTVMVIGFVNAGLLTLKQAISVVIGTNIGTTATAWLVSLEAFKITEYALPAVAIGFALHVFGRTRTIKDTGLIILGLCILFMGINFMKGAFHGLEQSEPIQNLLIKTANIPLMAILAGTIVTMLIQSSSAAVAAVQLMAVAGAFGHDWDIALKVAIPFILGSNIGTTITAQLAALQTNLNARRTAWAHTMFNIIGAFICFWFIAPLAKFARIVAPWELGPSTIAASIAITHTSIKIFEAVFFLPLTGLLEKIVVGMITEKRRDVETKPVILEYHLLGTPAIALDQAKREIVRMAKTAKKALRRAIAGIVENDNRKLDSVMTTEDLIDEFQFEITTYLSALSRKQLSDEVSKELPVLLHTVNDLERIGDHAVNIVEIAQRKIEQNLSFSDAALSEVAELRNHVDRMFDSVITALETNDSDAARSALVNENNINRLQIDLRRSHVQRMTDNRCSPETGLVFIDLVDNVEKIGDHLTNIAQAVIGGLQWAGIDNNALSGQYDALINID